MAIYHTVINWVIIIGIIAAVVIAASIFIIDLIKKMQNKYKKEED